MENAGATHDLIHDNPNFKDPALAILGQFADGSSKRRPEVEEVAQGLWKPAFRQTPAVTIDALVRKHALIEQVFVNGEPYAGTLEDAMLDESLPDEADAFTALTMTERGHELFEAYQPSSLLCGLVDDHPQYREVYAAALWACANDEGCSRADLEAEIRRFPALSPDPDSGQTKVYPQYFIDALESAGGIEWKDGTWHATAAGRQAVEQL